MKTTLIEFLNNDGDTLRGVLTIPTGAVKAGLICVHGFERCSTTEKKFKAIADRATENGVAVFRFDFSGTGLSDGSFKEITIERQGLELMNAVDAFKNEVNFKHLYAITHSLGACVLANKIEDIKPEIGKVVLIGPALNQKDLLRLWFVTGKMKKVNPDIKITWDNFKEYLNEDEFTKDCERTDKTLKMNYIDSDYFTISKDLDFSKYFDESKQEILHIHGDRDDKVPLESLNVTFKNQVLVSGGDHDLEKPAQTEQWLDKAISFLQ